MNNPTTAHSAIPTWRRRAIEVASIAVFLASVGAVARHTRGLKAVGDTDAYYDIVRSAIGAAPREFGEWVGVDVPVPVQAQDMLRPTAFLSRQFVNRTTGESCIITIVHCGDSRDMLGHFPPNCYPGQGWVLEKAQAIDFRASFGTLHATDYEFSRGRFGVTTTAMVTNAMLLPNGTTTPNLSGVESAMAVPYMRYHGVAQVQVFFDGAIAVERRREIAREMLEGHGPCILAIVRDAELKAD